MIDDNGEKKALRILMISDVYFPRINGVSTSIQTFARELQKRGHTITLLAPDYGNVPNEFFEVIRIPSRAVYRDPEDRLMSYRLVMKQLEQLRGRLQGAREAATESAADIGAAAKLLAEEIRQGFERIRKRL